jgi:3-oxoacyl-[acyl-carrier protein] reductase
VALARNGFDVIVHGRANRAAAKEVVDEVCALGRRADIVMGDVSDEDAVEAIFREVRSVTSHLNVLVNNAGIYPSCAFADLTPARWDEVLAVNVRGPFLVTRAAMPLMRAGGPGGRIINIGSVMALQGTEGALHYVTAKAATVGFTRGLARELGPDGITANCVVPSAVLASPDSNYGQWFDDIVNEQVVRRAQKPEDVANIIAFLASPESEFMTGQTVIADGGRVFG